MSTPEAIRRQELAGDVRDVIAAAVELAGWGDAADHIRLKCPAAVLLEAIDGRPGRRPRRRVARMDDAERRTFERDARRILKELRAQAARERRGDWQRPPDVARSTPSSPGGR